MKFRELKGMSLASNIINCVYMGALFVLLILESIVLSISFRGAGNMFGRVHGVDPSSPVSGYGALVHLFGGLFSGFVGIMVAVFLILTAILLVLFIAQNITGFVLFSKIRNAQLSDTKRYHASLADSIVKCVTSTLFLLVIFASRSGDGVSVRNILLMLPEAAVTVLSVISIVLAVKEKKKIRLN